MTWSQMSIIFICVCCSLKKHDIFFHCKRMKYNWQQHCHILQCLVLCFSSPTPIFDFKTFSASKYTSVMKACRILVKNCIIYPTLFVMDEHRIAHVSHIWRYHYLSLTYALETTLPITHICFLTQHCLSFRYVF